LSSNTFRCSLSRSRGASTRARWRRCARSVKGSCRTSAPAHVRATVRRSSGRTSGPGALSQPPTDHRTNTVDVARHSVIWTTRMGWRRARSWFTAALCVSLSFSALGWAAEPTTKERVNKLRAELSLWPERSAEILPRYIST
jgi:hypothetical protein